MKNTLYLIVLLLVSPGITHPCAGQNYACIKPGEKPYFTNGNGYLRAMRIDSIKTVGTDTIYYPFKTWRNIPSLDSGSWLGSRVIKKQDGTFLFNTMWNDTVAIRSQAMPGDSWMFYNDTSSRYYIATVTGMDTASIVGTIDSIKTILITSYTGSTVNTDDTLSYFEVKLSKHNGFLQIFDLYNFPYRKADPPGLSYYDWYLRIVTSPPFTSIPHGYPVSRFNSIFNRAYPHSPTGLEIYDFAVGDAFLVSGYHDAPWGASSSWKYYDSIVEKTIVNPYHTIYRTRRVSSRIIYTPPTLYFFDTSTGYIDVDTSVLLNLDVMPEELGVGRLPTVYYYRPNDTTGCTNSAYFAVDVPILFEGCNDRHIFKKGFPELEYATYTPPTPDDIGCHTSDQQKLIFSIKNSVMCGAYSLVPNKVNEPYTNKQASIYPNPANDKIFINCKPGAIGNVTVINTQGITVLMSTSGSSTVELPLTQLPPGIYIVRLDGIVTGKFLKL